MQNSIVSSSIVMGQVRRTMHNMNILRQVIDAQNAHIKKVVFDSSVQKNSGGRSHLTQLYKLNVKMCRLKGS